MAKDKNKKGKDIKNINNQKNKKKGKLTHKIQQNMEKSKNHKKPKTQKRPNKSQLENVERQTFKQQKNIRQASKKKNSQSKPDQINKNLKNQSNQKKNSPINAKKQQKGTKVAIQNKQKYLKNKQQNPQNISEYLSLYQHLKDQITKFAKIFSGQLQNSSQIDNLQRQVYDLKISIQRLIESNKLKNFQQLFNSLSYITSKLLKLMKDKDYLIKKINQQNHSRRYKNEKIKQSSPFFICNILKDEQDYQYFLKDELYHHVGEFKRTDFIYRYDGINKSNIHSYIDGRINLLFIIRTTDDRHIAAFTSSPFKKGQKSKGVAFISSLTNRRTFPLLPQKEALTYDQHYVIFGNSDLRIKNTEIYSNFGAANACYNSKGEKGQILFGKGKTNLSVIKQLEVFEVVFD